MIQPIPDIYLPRPATLMETRELTEYDRFFRFEMDPGQRLAYQPGQFIMLTVIGVGQAPISIMSCPEGEKDRSFELVIRKVGNVTDAVHRLEPGAKVGVRGPYGTSFPVGEGMEGRDLLFVCGGLGLVPVHSAIAYVLRERERYGKVTILVGTRSPEQRLLVDELEGWATREDVTLLETVDVARPGWGKHVGIITNLFSLVTLDPSRTTAIVCGPPIMYKFVLLELFKMRMAPEQIFVSLERNMKCGVGKCGRCQINHLYACQDGPVMNYADIMNVREAV